MEDERINVRTELSHYERHAVRHKPANEMHVAPQAVSMSYSKNRVDVIDVTLAIPVRED